MSKEFLDINGLSTYNDLIQDWVDDKHQIKTQAEYDAIPAAEKNTNGVIYFISDGGTVASGGSANNVSFNNTGTGLSATTVQAAIVEILNMLNNSVLPHLSIEEE